MTNEEALNWLIHKISIDVQNSIDLSKDTECLLICKRALELCSKKKPDKYYDGYYDGFPVWEYKCPNCGREVDDTDHHCECGQAIDWNEDNE